MNSLAIISLKDTVSTNRLFTGVLSGNVKNPDLFIYELFKGVLLTAQVIQLRIKCEGYVCYSTTLFNFTGHLAAKKVITYQESMIRILLLVTNQLVGLHIVEWGDFELSVGKNLEESVRRLFQLTILAVAGI
jgi:hypothetical protein